MLFKKKSPALPSVLIRSGDSILYQGLLKEIPIKESVIIEKSIFFFDDPEPCFIHRDAVRVRLTEELLQEIQEQTGTHPSPHLIAYADLDGIETCQLL